MKKANIQKKTNSYVVKYPLFLELQRKQQRELFWTDDEVNLEKDKQDLLVEMTPAEQHAIRFNQRSFSWLEDNIGSEYWMGIVLRRYPRHEIARMAAAFGNVELNIHLPFYTKVNEVLGSHEDEFYDEMLTTPELMARREFMEELVRDKDSAASIAGFAMIEGAVLFTAFAMIKSFQANGRNLLTNFCAGINMSALDEHTHMIGGALIFRTQIEEEQRSEEEMEVLTTKIHKHAHAIFEHECALIDAMLAMGEAGESKENLRAFAASRIDICLDALGLPTIFNVKHNPIAEWFYNNMNGYLMNDFFLKVGREYSKVYNEIDFDLFDGEGI